METFGQGQGRGVPWSDSLKKEGRGEEGGHYGHTRVSLELHERGAPAKPSAPWQG